jgi:long-chain acyl-CoA synthetase
MMKNRPWLKSYGSIPSEIDAYRYESVVHMLESAMAKYAGKNAFCSFGKSITYAQVDALSAQFCSYLQNELGVKKGDRVAVMMPNLAAFPIAFLGIMRAGAIQVNVNPLYTPRELEHQLNDSSSETIVIFSGVSATLAEVLGKTSIKKVITVSPGDGLGLELPSPPVDGRLADCVTFASALEMGNRSARLPVDITSEDVLFLQYTGGTTGLSKGATLTHRNLVANTEQYKAFMPVAIRSGEEVIVTAIPLYHIFALMVNFITYFSVGAENWLVANPRDMNGFVDVLKASKPTVFMGVNTLYAGLTMHPDLKNVDWSRLRLCGGGGSAVLEATSKKWQEITGQFIREGYGLSETSPVASFNPHFINDFTGTTGLPMPSTDIKLLDEESQEVPFGGAGEVCVKGPQVMRGYWEKPDANSEAFTVDGYFKTGDIGLFTEEGYLKIIDRKKDMILVSGFNVYPNEIEAVAASCPGVAETACIGIKNEKTGEAVVLFVVKTPNSELTQDQIVAHCQKLLTAYKVPKTINFVESLPKSTVGKILRRELRDKTFN